MTQKRTQVTLGSPGMLRIIRVVDAATEPMDGRQIAKLAHVSFLTFANQYRHVLLDAGLIHLAAWKRNYRGPYVPAYMLGTRPAGVPEPVKPEKITSVERSQKWKKETGYNEARKANRRLVRPPDFALAALLGLNARYSKNTTTAAMSARKEMATA